MFFESLNLAMPEGCLVIFLKKPIKFFFVNYASLSSVSVA